MLGEFDLMTLGLGFLQVPRSNPLGMTVSQRIAVIEPGLQINALLIWDLARLLF